VLPLGETGSDWPLADGVMNNIAFGRVGLFPQKANRAHRFDDLAL